VYKFSVYINHGKTRLRSEPLNISSDNHRTLTV